MKIKLLYSFWLIFITFTRGHHNGNLDPSSPNLNQFPTVIFTGIGQSC